MATANLAVICPAHKTHLLLGSTNQRAAGHADSGGTKAGRWLVTHTHTHTHTQSDTHTQDINMDAVFPL